MRLLLLIFSACLVLTQVLADRRKEHKTEWKSNAKQHHVGHWGEHWTTTDKPNSRNVKEVLKHAPGVVTHHDARLQSDLGYRKHSQEKHREHDDLHLQDLTLGESMHHDSHQQKLQKPMIHRQGGHQVQSSNHHVPTHSNDHHMAHAIEHHNPSHADFRSGSHHLPKQPKPEIHRNPYKNMHIPPEVTKSHPDKKDHKQEKKYPKKFNKAKHEKKAHKILNH